MLRVFGNVAADRVTWVTLTLDALLIIMDAKLSFFLGFLLGTTVTLTIVKSGAVIWTLDVSYRIGEQVDVHAKQSPSQELSFRSQEPCKQKNPACPDNLGSITKAINSSGSDKLWFHHYERYYERWLQDFRCKRGLKLVEIGAQHGRSLKVWSDIFVSPKTILGVAYGKSAQDVEKALGPKTSVMWGDQSKNTTMQELIKRGPWDIIIDDGSHYPPHMTFSLFSLWRSVNPGGLYIIEGLETNYWEHGTKLYGYVMQHTGINATAQYSVVRKIEQITQVLMRYHLGAENLSVMPGDDRLCSVEWGMNLVKLRKCTEAEYETHPRYKRKKASLNVINEWLIKAKSTNPFVAKSSKGAS